MALDLVDLNHPDTRQFMLEEIELDISKGNLYISPRLTAAGARDYPDLLRAAARTGTDASLAADLRCDGRIRTTEERRTPKGGITTARVPVTAADTLAEGEFNRFYARALCRRANVEGLETLIVYRAKEVDRPRAESEALKGSALEAGQLLEDLRRHTGTDTALGLPAGPNSGLSVRLPRLARAVVQGG